MAFAQEPVGSDPRMTHEETLVWCAGVVRDYTKVGLLSPGWGLDLELRIQHGPKKCNQPQCSCHYPPGTDLRDPELKPVSDPMM